MIWDRFIRLFHWCTAALFLFNYFLSEGGSDLHEWAGYSLLALLAARIIWGFRGSAPARFSSFFPTPRRLVHTWKNFAAINAQHNGHNAIGGLMIFALLGGILLTGVTGWMQGLDYFWGETWLENLHEWLANLVMAGVAIHVLAVVVIQIKYRVPLIQGMTYRKKSSKQ